ARSGGTGPYGNGINVFRAGGVVVSNNVIDDCDFSAIRMNSGTNVQILGNACRRLGETAIFAEFGFDGAVIANNIIDGAASGISITNFNSGGRLGVASGNIVRNLNTTSRLPTEDPIYGIGIAAEADVAITGNVIEGAPSVGIALGWGPYLRDVTANANVIRHAGIGIAVSAVEGSGSAVITDNLIADATRGAVLGMRWREIATGELADGTASDTPAHVSVSRNRVS
ncbi:MAG: TIGR03808 family TAT-translocated repetitive protein, partial [Hyphomicrobiaceae bacterium]|nr:TIGR03808 family TAT-translocated repetitive protein [Hyphomicrobiaceae bacterium]